MIARCAILPDREFSKYELESRCVYPNTSCLMRRSIGERVWYEQNHAPASITKREITSDANQANGTSSLPASAAGCLMPSTVSVRCLVAYEIEANAPRLSTGKVTKPRPPQGNWR